MRTLKLPLTADEVASLQAYDQIELSGTLYVGRDQVHSRLCAMIEQGEELPLPLQGATIFYMAPSPAPKGMIIGSCGPTTSARMDAFSPMLLDRGLKVMVGKGPRSAEVREAIIRNKALYLQAYGGCGALYARSVKKVKTLAFESLGPEALLELEVERFPVIVAIDSHGNSVFESTEV